MNGLSDLQAQLLILNKGHKKVKECYTNVKSIINKYNITDFQFKLNHETCEQLLMGMILIRFLTFSEYLFKNLLF